MRCPIGLAAVVLTVGLSHVPRVQTTSIEIELSHNTAGEQSEAERLQHLLAQLM